MSSDKAFLQSMMRKDFQSLLIAAILPQTLCLSLPVFYQYPRKC